MFQGALKIGEKKEEKRTIYSKCKIIYRFYSHGMGEAGHFIALWPLEHFTALKIGEMF